jgi:Transposase and inactivated derivatives
VWGVGSQKGLEKIGNHTQKKTKHYREQDPSKVKEYQQTIADIPTDRIAYVDETGIDEYLHREYGRAKRGNPIYSRVSGRKYKRTGIVAAQIGKCLTAPMQYDGTMDGALFEMWFEQLLLPTLPQNTVIVMDNASFHRKSRLTSIAESTSHTLLFLPPYSPELNPIENFWAWLKRHLRKILPSRLSFDDALHECFQVR